jgi:hypothetical protein
MTMVMAPHRVVKEQAAKLRPARKVDDESDGQFDDRADSQSHDDAEAAAPVAAAPAE